MSGDLVEVAKSGALAPVMDLLHKLAGPATEQIGLMLGEKVWAYRAKNLITIVEKTRRRLKNAGISANAVPPRLLLPVIDNCSLEDDETLQDMWAGLLATASSETDAMSPGYIETLKQLTPNEARFLEDIYKVNFGCNPQITYFSPYAFDDPAHRRYRDSFERLGLVRREFGLTRDVPSSERGVGFTVHITEYGRDFLIACHGPVR